MNPEAVTKRLRAEKLFTALTLENAGDHAKALAIVQTLYPRLPIQTIAGIINRSKGIRIMVDNTSLDRCLNYELDALEKLSFLAADTIRTKLKDLTNPATTKNALGSSPVATPQVSATTTPKTDNPHQRAPNAQQRNTTIPPLVLDVEAFLNPQEPAQFRNTNQATKKPTASATPPQPTLSLDPEALAKPQQNQPYNPFQATQSSITTHGTPKQEHIPNHPPRITHANSQQTSTPDKDYPPSTTLANTLPIQGPVFPVPAHTMIYALAGVLAEISEFGGGYKYEEAKELFFKALHPEFTVPPLQLKRLFQNLGEEITNKISNNPNAYLSELFEGPLKQIAMQIEEDELAIQEETEELQDEYGMSIQPYQEDDTQDREDTTGQ